MKSEEEINHMLEWFKDDIIYKAPEEVVIRMYDLGWIKALTWILTE